MSSGCSNAISSRKLKYHYGVGLMEPFRNGIDCEEDAHHCPVMKTKWAEGYISWVAKKGSRHGAVLTEFVTL